MRARGNSQLTRGFAANVGKKSCNFLQPQELPFDGAKPIRLVVIRSGDERMVVPEIECMGEWRVTLREEALKLVGLEVVGNSPATAFRRIPFTAPPLLAPTVSALTDWNGNQKQ